VNKSISTNSTVILIIGLLFLYFIADSDLPSLSSVETQNSTVIQIDKQQIYIPITISKEAKEEIKHFKMNPAMVNSPQPDDLETWKKLNQEREAPIITSSKPVIDLYQPNVTSKEIGGVNVLDIKPKNWIDNGRVLVYTHGGGYTQLSANSTLGSAVLVANNTGLRVISIDYTLAPFSKWNQTTDQVVSVIRDLKDKQGYRLENIGIFGDSAGGGLALGSALKMRDSGIGMPAAVIVLSPWTDIARNGDTYYTLREADPVLISSSMKNFADAYADPSDQKIPYVSPVNGNFSKGFPPTLIQVGTKEIFLSDSIRLYQALDQANISVKLDVYEGMPHVFQFYLHGTPESDVAISKMVDFFKVYLRY
jgi:acetyl esterase/lipase